MKITIAYPFALTALLVLSCGLVKAQTANKTFKHDTDEIKSHGSVTLTVEEGSKYGTAFNAGFNGYRGPVVYKRDTLVTEIVAEPVAGKEREFVKLLVEGLGLAPAVADKATSLVYRHAHVDEYYTNDVKVPTEGEVCNVTGQNGTVLIPGFVAGAGYLKGSSLGVEMVEWNKDGLGVGELYASIQYERDRPTREKGERKEREKAEKEKAKLDREEAKRKAKEETEARKRAEKESKKPFADQPKPDPAPSPATSTRPRTVTSGSGAGPKPQ
jgi:hypothetical protein